MHVTLLVVVINTRKALINSVLPRYHAVTVLWFCLCTAAAAAAAPHLQPLRSVAPLRLTSPSERREVGQISWQWRPFPLLRQMWHTFSCSACIMFCFGSLPAAESHVDVQRDRSENRRLLSFYLHISPHPCVEIHTSLLFVGEKKVLTYWEKIRSCFQDILR